MIDNLLPMWLRDAENKARAEARRGFEAFEAMTDKSTRYALSIEAIADAHSEAADVYARRLAAFHESARAAEIRRGSK